MTESNAALLESLNTLYEVFVPRRNWSTPSFESDESSQDIVIELFKLYSRKACNLSYSEVRHETFSGIKCADDYTERMAAVTHARRGKADLKNEMWSGYKFLQEKYLGEELEGYSAGLPFMYVARSGSEAITAGNVSPRVMLKWMADENISTISIVGIFVGVPEGKCPASVRGSGHLGLATLDLNLVGLTHIKRFFELEELEFRIALQRYGRNIHESY